MTQRRSTDSQNIDDEGDFATQLKNLTDYTHTEINNLYSIFDILEKKILHIERQENYQSQYSINERLDKLERREMQEPLSYDDVIDIKNQINELKKIVKESNTQTIHNTKQVNEMSNKIEYIDTDEPNNNEFNDLKSEVNNIKRHLNSYSAPLNTSDIDKSNQKKESNKLRRSMIPVPPSKSRRNTNNRNDSQVSNDSTEQENIEQSETKELDLNDEKLEASEASSASAKVQEKEAESTTNTEHTKSKPKKLSKKASEIDSSEQSKNKSENSNDNGNSEMNDKSKSEKSEKSEKKEKPKIGKIKPLKPKTHKKDKKENDSSKKKSSIKEHKSEASKN